MSTILVITTGIMSYIRQSFSSDKELWNIAKELKMNSNITKELPQYTPEVRIKICERNLQHIKTHIQEVKRVWKIYRSIFKKEYKPFSTEGIFLIDKMIEAHDESKLSKEEFIPYANWFYGPYGISYDFWDDGSLGAKEHTRCKNEFDKAWEHHKTNNNHHWQNWTNDSTLSKIEQLSCCICMLMDWKAMENCSPLTIDNFYQRTIAEERPSFPLWLLPIINEIISRLTEV